MIEGKRGTPSDATRTQWLEMFRTSALKKNVKASAQHDIAFKMKKLVSPINGCHPEGNEEQRDEWTRRISLTKKTSGQGNTLSDPTQTSTMEILQCTSFTQDDINNN